MRGPWVFDGARNRRQSPLVKDDLVAAARLGDSVCIAQVDLVKVECGTAPAGSPLNHGDVGRKAGLEVIETAHRVPGEEKRFCK